MLLSLLRHFQFKASSFCNNGQRWPTPMFLSCYFRCCILYVVPAVLRAEKSNNTSAEMSASLSDTSNRYVHCVYEVMLDNTKYVSYIDINGGYHRSRLFWLRYWVGLRVTTQKIVFDWLLTYTWIVATNAIAEKMKTMTRHSIGSSNGNNSLSCDKLINETSLFHMNIIGWPFCGRVSFQLDRYIWRKKMYFPQNTMFWLILLHRLDFPPIILLFCFKYTFSNVHPMSTRSIDKIGQIKQRDMHISTLHHSWTNKLLIKNCALNLYLFDE